MAGADELDRARAALQMINAAPYNAEAPPEALAGEITPTESPLRPQQLRAARRTTARSSRRRRGREPARR